MPTMDGNLISENTRGIARKTYMYDKGNNRESTFFNADGEQIDLYRKYNRKHQPHERENNRTGIFNI